MRLTLELPDTLTEAEARLAIALRLWEDRSVSTGKAAEIANLPYRRFLEELGKRGLPAIRYEEDELGGEASL